LPQSDTIFAVCTCKLASLQSAGQTLAFKRIGYV